MTEAKHTPGPWAFDRDSVWSNAAVQGNIICDCPRYKFNASGKNWSATARLIAAAPDMLASLMEIIKACDVCGKDDDLSLVDTFTQEMEDRARAAIAKATGEA